jgi:ubiquinone/menaquinone biosynthesis C-methylase UbiE
MDEEKPREQSLDDTRQVWDRLAADWEIQVGDDGDSNRRLNSDPVLWQMAGDVKGLIVLDAGCGTGYLAKRLHEKGAKVVGVDVSPKMVEIAIKKHRNIDFRVGACSDLKDFGTGFFDLVVSNYVLMDVPDMDETVQAFHRVLKPGGVAVLIFSHPCFPQGKADEDGETGDLLYRWDHNYFEESRQVGPPWAHFKSEFVWHHRPLAAYWKSFQSAGFEIADLQEPRLTPERYHLALNERQLDNGTSRPYSIAFKLRKPSAA